MTHYAKTCVPSCTETF